MRRHKALEQSRRLAVSLLIIQAALTGFAAPYRLYALDPLFFFINMLLEIHML